MGTKSLTVGGALVFGLWLVLSAWTFLGLATMRIPAGPRAEPAPPVAQVQEPQKEDDGCVPGLVAVADAPRAAAEPCARR